MWAFTVSKVKLGRGHYRITRNDGYSIEVRRGVKDWFQVASGWRAATLSTFEYDMRMGYTAHDIQEKRHGKKDI